MCYFELLIFFNIFISKNPLWCKTFQHKAPLIGEFLVITILQKNKNKNSNYIENLLILKNTNLDYWTVPTLAEKEMRIWIPRAHRTSKNNDRREAAIPCGQLYAAEPYPLHLPTSHTSVETSPLIPRFSLAISLHRYLTVTAITAFRRARSCWAWRKLRKYSATSERMTSELFQLPNAMNSPTSWSSPLVDLRGTCETFLKP